MIRPQSQGFADLLPQGFSDLLQGRAPELRVAKSGPATRAVLAAELLGRGYSVVLVARDGPERAAMQAMLRAVCPAGAPGGTDPDSPVAELQFEPWTGPWTVLRAFKPERMDAASWAPRMAALHALAQPRRARGVLLTADNLLPWWPPKDVTLAHNLELARGEDLSPDLILEQVVEWGYERVTFVTRPGEVAVRGDIVDVFAPGYDAPLRLEFFGDAIEDMRIFDPASQRSQGSLDNALLLPVAGAVLTPDFSKAARKRWASQFQDGELTERELHALERDLEAGRAASLMPGRFYDAPTKLTDWLDPKAVWLLPGEEELATVLDQALWSWQERNRDEESEEDSAPQEGPAQAADPALRSRRDVIQDIAPMRRVHFEDLVMGVERAGLELSERPVSGFEDLMFRVGGQSPDEARDRPWHALVAALKEWSRSKRGVYLCFHTERSRARFLKLAEEEGILPRLGCSLEQRVICAVVAPLDTGAELAWRDTLILPEAMLQPGGRRRPPPDKSFAGLRSHEGLEKGELLVHRDYGLGRFDSLVRMEAGGAGNDFLLILYQGDDKLYLPVDRMGLVQRYKGPEDIEPGLDRLGGVGWIRTREKARKAIERIARELVQMYAYRKVAKGFSYSPVGELYREFEASFGFEETPDQARAIEDVLRDMEKNEPMDRLVCGDVGFGKTEVAMRAAFRAAVDGKQTALLCPTTVLAEQHYQNFRHRFRGAPVQVSMLSRFVPKAKQAQILKAAARGQVDILIGTHRLLSEDVDLPRLGLLVLDEEQRFGVKHKERLKELRKTIDVLTLTATPIPRTLQLSLSGIRSLSVIETPPSERKPVATSLVERDDAMLAKILRQELDRQGQVFWVHNRVRGLAEVETYVRKLAPGARVGHAHGQMPERELEEAMHNFWHGELDILVCTAIIESGLDFPRANTLVVDQAHMFGLGQLYQLRGRVGRSDRQAYAYFVVNDFERLQETARKRLKIILDMEYLGAGFQVAMEDLRLRGAGNILGESQSGHMAKVGLELYLAMLEDEVSRLKGEPVREATDPELTIAFSANIPETFITDSRERLMYYKGFTSAGSARARDDLEAEVRDRFGPLPEDLENFLGVLKLKEVLGSLQVAKAEVFPTRVRLTWGEDVHAVDPQRLIQWVAERPSRAKLSPPSTLELRLPESGNLRDRLLGAGSDLSRLSALKAGEDGHNKP